MNIVLLGVPGSGKGTQALRIGQQLDVPTISTGELFRKNVDSETELGSMVKKYLDRGDLVPDDVTSAMVRDRLALPDTQAGFILDGFPRTLAQAEALTEMMLEMNRQIDIGLYIHVADDKIVERLSGRLVCRECQTPFHKIYNPFKTCPFAKCQEGEYLYQCNDDNPETVRARLKVFHSLTKPLIEYYRQAGILVEIDGVGEVAEVFERAVTAIKTVNERAGV